MTKDGANLNGSFVGQGLDTDLLLRIRHRHGLRPERPGAPATPARERSAGSRPDRSAASRATPNTTTGWSRPTPSARPRATTGPSPRRPGHRSHHRRADRVTNEAANLNGSFDGRQIRSPLLLRIRADHQLREQRPVPARGVPWLQAAAGRRFPRCTQASRKAATTTTGSSPLTQTGKPSARTRSFKTAEPPQINNLSTENVTATSAELNAEINPTRAIPPTTSNRARRPPTATRCRSPTRHDSGRLDVESRSRSTSTGSSSEQTYHFRARRPEPVRNRSIRRPDLRLLPAAVPERAGAPGNRLEHTFPTAGLRVGHARRTPPGR